LVLLCGGFGSVNGWRDRLHDLARVAAHNVRKEISGFAGIFLSLTDLISADLRKLADERI
jgi:hypothetical protein